MRLTFRQAQKDHGLKAYTYAKLRETTRGRYTTFRRGTRVRVCINEDMTCTIERDKWRGTPAPLANVLCGVPVEKLQWTD